MSELLNELSEEKEYFERKKEHFLSKWSIDNAENIQLRQENKELKKENDNKFKFNVNQAKAYHIKSISSNGVVRTGKKNSKVSWRMKDVREISQELPPFEDFNREIFQQIKNKFHTKFDNDVIGRIIYNIYVGTFDEYI